MAVPSSPNARLFYRAADQRFEDAEFLLKAKRTTAAVYLAGYAVECILKALILSNAPKSRQDEVLNQFRGARAHDYDWLLNLYRERGGSELPRDIVREFARVNTWSTRIRYSPSTVPMKRATSFTTSAESIVEWAKGRTS